MQLIPTRIHAVIDYIVAIVLLGLPYLFDAWSGGGAAIWVPMALGIALIIYSLVTSYELGVVHLLPMPVHLLLDAVSGVILVLSPFFFGFANRISLPYIVMGLFEIATALLTQHRAGSLQPDAGHVRARHQS